MGEEEEILGKKGEEREGGKKEGKEEEGTGGREGKKENACHATPRLPSVSGRPRSPPPPSFLSC